ncbi:MAG: DUF222 domain-containing protein [Gammaproteobacteria bacterium]|nr:DUF222 domain-containing protein [Gammaproteobacteria bacterium]MDH5618085.1 DUF222 domain-containing protein [Gammaproteobacteria bacterium]
MTVTYTVSIDVPDLDEGANAATYELLVLIREFDERAGWLKWGLQNCAEWLAWRCDVSMMTALEKVRVAHALKALAHISRAVAKGELSHSKVRALSRVTNKNNERDLIKFAVRQVSTISCCYARSITRWFTKVDPGSSAYEIPPRGGLLSVKENSVAEPAAPACLH